VIHRIDDGHAGLLYAGALKPGPGVTAGWLSSFSAMLGAAAGALACTGGRVGGRLGSGLFGGVQIVVVALVGLTLATSLLLLLRMLEY
jgi:hypothetical protein